MQAELTAHELRFVKISQITKTDKTKQTLTTKYPLFIVIIQPSTGVSEVLQIKKLCNCIVWWKKYKNTKPVRQCFTCQTFGRSSNFCGKPPKVRHVRTTTCNAGMQKSHWPAYKMRQLRRSPPGKILPIVLHINNSTSYINGNRASRSR